MKCYNNFSLGALIFVLIFFLALSKCILCFLFCFSRELQDGEHSGQDLRLLH